MSGNENRVERDQNLIDKIGKLLAKAAGTKVEAERDLFTAKAMDLIAANNLDMAAISEGGESARAAKRADEKLAGGLYQFQRDLWGAVSDLNFVMYFNLYSYVPDKISKYWIKQYGGKAHVPESKRGGYEFRHRLVGRTVNIAATKAMCQYLESTLDRLVRERLPGQPNLWNGSWATAYREGATTEIVRKINARRAEQLVEEQRKAQEARDLEDARREGMASTGTSVTLASVKQDEEAANYDFMHGDGAYAKKMAQRAKWAQQREEEEARYTKWAAENPAEAKKQAEELYKSVRRSSWNAGMGSGKERAGDKHYDAYNSGREAGRKVSIDPQMGDRTARRLK